MNLSRVACGLHRYSSNITGSGRLEGDLSHDADRHRLAASIDDDGSHVYRQRLLRSAQRASGVSEWC